MLLIGRALAASFVRFALASGLSFARCNDDWFALYAPNEYRIALAWLASMGVRRFVYPV